MTTSDKTVAGVLEQARRSILDDCCGEDRGVLYCVLCGETEYDRPWDYLEHADGCLVPLLPQLIEVALAAAELCESAKRRAVRDRDVHDGKDWYDVGMPDTAIIREARLRLALSRIGDDDASFRGDLRACHRMAARKKEARK